MPKLPPIMPILKSCKSQFRQRSIAPMDNETGNLKDACMAFCLNR